MHFVFSGWRSRQRQPRGESGELFVLRPRRAKGPPEFGNPAHERCRLDTENLPGLVEKFAFLDALRSQAESCASVNDGFAEELSVRGVNQRMRGKNFFQFRKRSS